MMEPVEPDTPGFKKNCNPVEPCGILQRPYMKQEKIRTGSRATADQQHAGFP
jgi:hypothetical protein